MKGISRRKFIQQAGLGLGAGMLFPGGFRTVWATEPKASEEHFFIQLVLDEGADWSYLFDARPLAMTEAKLMQNYLGKEPYLWDGSNGQETWASELTRPLLPYKDFFSVVNGVVMSTAFDGHDQNLNLYFTGSAFGGESFVPFLNQAGLARSELDYVQLGRLLYYANNGGNSLQLLENSRNITRKLKSEAAGPGLDPVMSYVQSRASYLQSQAAGSWGQGLSLFKQALESAPRVSLKLSQIDLNPEGGQGIAGTIEMVKEYFRVGLARSAVIGLGFPLDVHAADSAKNQPEIYTQVVDQILGFLKALREIPFDEQRSMLDVTTFAITSEFNRTMRQHHQAIDKTGTDHNPNSNSAILGGKGIKGGLVLGESDYRNPDEELSAVHLKLDRNKLNLVGKPFDFSRSLTYAEGGSEFKPEKYLMSASLVNTLLACFNVPQQNLRRIDGSEKVAPSLKLLLS